jgi:hypothetical protein
MSQVREINLKTGEEKTRPYTADELAAIAAYAPPPLPPTPTLAQLQAQLAALAAQIAALTPPNEGGP